MHGEQRTTILFVEDSPDEELLIRRAIQESCLGVEIVVAHSTDEALELLFPKTGVEAILPALILTDLRVNSIGGAGLVSALRERPETRLIPTVVFTGHASEAQIDDLYRRGASSFIEKPMDFEQFTLAICRIVSYWSDVNTVAPAQRPADRFRVH